MSGALYSLGKTLGLVSRTPAAVSGLAAPTGTGVFLTENGQSRELSLPELQERYPGARLEGAPRPVRPCFQG